MLVLPNSRIVVDSRLVQRGDTFVATKSDGSFFYRGAVDQEYREPYKFDSHPHIQDAIDRGASMIVYSDRAYAPNHPEVQSLYVEDGIQYLVDLLTRVIRDTSKKVVAVTGSTGKSTTCELVMRALGANVTYKHLSDRPTPISIPVKALNNPHFYEAAYFVVEMPMDGLGQITELCQVAPPDVGVILNINDSHLQQLGTIQNIVTAKMELVWQAAANKGLPILNGDDQYLNVQALNLTRREINHLTFGRNVLNNIRITQSVWNGSGYQHTFARRGVIRTLDTRFISKSIAYSLAAAIAAAGSVGVNFVEAIENLQGVSPLPGRMSVLKGIKGETILDDTRLATPQSTLELFKSVMDIPLSRKILIQGPVLREYQHGKISEAAFKLMKSFDAVNLYGETNWLTYPNDFTTHKNEGDIVRWYQKNVKPGDLVVFNGSEGVQMWNLVQNFVQPEEIEKVYNPNKDD